MKSSVSSLMNIRIATAIVLLLAAGNSARAADTTPPELVSLTISPTVINTSTTNRTVVFTGRVTDDLSGVSVVDLTFRHESGQDERGGRMSCINPSAQPQRDCQMRGEYEFPQYVRTGKWILYSISFSDRANNHRRIPASNTTVADEAFWETLGIPCVIITTE